MIIIFHCLCKLLVQFLKIRKQKRIEVDIPRNTIKFSPPVYCQRYAAVVETLLEEKWRKQMRKLVDFGCSNFGIFVFLKRLNLNSITFVDIDEELLKDQVYRVLPYCAEYTNRRPQPLEVTVFSGSVADPDFRLLSMDAVTAVELIEHLYPDVLEAFPYNVFGFIRPKLAIVTTPNADFNVLFSDNLNRFRHDDHKFEWTREEFEQWATNITVRFPDYTVSFSGIGEGPKGTEHLGHCSQMAVFVRKDLLDNNYIWNTTIACLCHDDSPCKGATTDSKLLCRCVCPCCCPTASYGICTYHTCSKHIVSDEKVEVDTLQSNGSAYYKFIKNVEYPFNDDTRTEDQIILDELRYRINSLGQPGSLFYNRDEERAEIPIWELTYGQEGVCITQPELCKMLISDGYQVEDVPIKQSIIGESQLCVIYFPEAASSSPSVADYDSDNSRLQCNKESSSDWDEEYDNATTEATTVVPQQKTELLPNYLPQNIVQH